MPYEYLEDAVTSDVTFRASGGDVDALFTAAADATTNCMVASLASLAEAVAIPVALDADALDLLLVRLLDELVFYKDARRLLLRARDVRVVATATGHRVQATLRGERIDPSRHELASDVKAVTFHGLRVARVDDGWEAQVTLDV